MCFDRTELREEYRDLVAFERCVEAPRKERNETNGNRQQPSATFETEVLKSERQGDRRLLGRVVRAVPRRLARARADRRRARAQVVKVNIDEQQELAQRYGVASIPSWCSSRTASRRRRPSARCRRARSSARSASQPPSRLRGRERRASARPRSVAARVVGRSRNDWNARCLARYVLDRLTPSSAHSVDPVARRGRPRSGGDVPRRPCADHRRGSRPAA